MSYNDAHKTHESWYIPSKLVVEMLGIHIVESIEDCIAVL